MSILFQEMYYNLIIHLWQLLLSKSSILAREALTGLPNMSGVKMLALLALQHLAFIYAQQEATIPTLLKSIILYK